MIYIIMRMTKLLVISLLLLLTIISLLLLNREIYARFILIIDIESFT